MWQNRLRTRSTPWSISSISPRHRVKTHLSLPLNSNTDTISMFWPTTSATNSTWSSRSSPTIPRTRLSSSSRPTWFPSVSCRSRLRRACPDSTRFSTTMLPTRWHASTESAPYPYRERRNARYTSTSIPTGLRPTTCRSKPCQASSEPRTAMCPEVRSTSDRTHMRSECRESSSLPRSSKTFLSAHSAARSSISRMWPV